MNYSTEIKTILKSRDINGGPFWAREDGDIHAPHGKSTIDTLLVLGELGANVKDYPEIQDAVEFVFRYQADDGCFRYSGSSSKLPCMSARILASFGRLQVPFDRRVESGYKKLLNTQSDDGGWRCNTVKLGKSPLTDASNPGTTLYLLDAFRFRENTNREKVKLDSGVEFLLNHWLSRKPMGPCVFGIGSRFLQIEYPFLRYNIFYYAYILSFYKKALMDNRFIDVYENLADRIENNKLIPENPHRTWNKYSFAKKGEVSEIGTKRWLEIKKNLYN